MRSNTQDVLYLTKYGITKRRCKECKCLNKMVFVELWPHHTKKWAVSCDASVNKTPCPRNLSEGERIKEKAW